VIELLLTVIVADGTLTVTRTDECYIHAEYENRLAGGPTDQAYDIDGNTVTVEKNADDIPERLIVFALGKEYAIDVSEYETGTVCVPYYQGS